MSDCYGCGCRHRLSRRLYKIESTSDARVIVRLRPRLITVSGYSDCIVYIPGNHAGTWIYPTWYQLTRLPKMKIWDYVDSTLLLFRLNPYLYMKQFSETWPISLSYVLSSFRSAPVFLRYTCTDIFEGSTGWSGFVLIRWTFPDTVTGYDSRTV